MTFSYLASVGLFWVLFSRELKLTPSDQLRTQEPSLGSAGVCPLAQGRAQCSPALRDLVETDSASALGLVRKVRSRKCLNPGVISKTPKYFATSRAGHRTITMNHCHLLQLVSKPPLTPDPIPSPLAQALTL